MVSLSYRVFLTGQPCRQSQTEILVGAERRAQDLLELSELTKLYPNEPFRKRSGLLYDQAKNTRNGLELIYSRGRVMFDFLHHDRLLYVVQLLVRPDISCNPIQHLCAQPPLLILKAKKAWLSSCFLASGRWRYDVRG